MAKKATGGGFPASSWGADGGAPGQEQVQFGFGGSDGPARAQTGTLQSAGDAGIQMMQSGSEFDRLRVGLADSGTPKFDPLESSTPGAAHLQAGRAPAGFGAESRTQVETTGLDAGRVRGTGVDALRSDRSGQGHSGIQLGVRTIALGKS